MGNFDTVLLSEDLLLRVDKQYNFAPAQGNNPLSLWKDLDAEELSHPKLFAGRHRPLSRPRNISYGGVCKAELKKQK